MPGLPQQVSLQDSRRFTPHGDPVSACLVPCADRRPLLIIDTLRVRSAGQVHHMDPDGPAESVIRGKLRILRGILAPDVVAKAVANRCGSSNGGAGLRAGRGCARGDQAEPPSDAAIQPAVDITGTIEVTLPSGTAVGITARIDLAAWEGSGWPGGLGMPATGQRPPRWSRRSPAAAGHSRRG